MATRRTTYTQKPYPAPLQNIAQEARYQDGWNGDKKTPYTYIGQFGRSFGMITNNNLPSSAMGALTGTLMSQFASSGGVPSWGKLTYNSAYGKFRAKVWEYEGASLGTLLGEIGENAKLILTRSTQLLRILRLLRRGNWQEALAVAGVDNSGYTASGWKKKPTPRSPRQPLDESSSAILEYQFAWSPFVGDIAAAAAVMGSNPSSGPVSARAYTNVVRNTRSTNFDYFDSDIYLEYKIGARIGISNPNYALANHLGLINPVQIVWELVPFSFLVDKVLDIGSFLGSFTDFVGLNVEKPWVTCYAYGSDTYSVRNHTTVKGSTTAIASCLIRKTGIPLPVPAFKGLSGIAPTVSSAASTLALATQILLSVKK